jgi:hypothetical protein
MLPPPSLVVKIKSTRKERPVNAKSSSDETDKKCDEGKYGGGEEHGFRGIREKTFFGSSSTLIFQERKTKDS